MDENEMVFIPATTEERGDVAAWLIATCDAKQVSRTVVLTRNGGFLVPSSLLDAGEPSFVPDLVPDPHAGELDLAKVVEVVKEVRAELADNGREKIRAWAKEQGIEVAEKGQLKKAVLDAYEAAH